MSSSAPPPTLAREHLDRKLRVIGENLLSDLAVSVEREVERKAKPAEKRADFWIQGLEAIARWPAQNPECLRQESSRLLKNLAPLQPERGQHIAAELLRQVTTECFSAFSLRAAPSSPSSSSSQAIEKLLGLYLYNLASWPFFRLLDNIDREPQYLEQNFTIVFEMAMCDFALLHSTATTTSPSITRPPPSASPGPPASPGSAASSTLPPPSHSAGTGSRPQMPPSGSPSRVISLRSARGGGSGGSGEHSYRSDDGGDGHSYRSDDGHSYDDDRSSNGGGGHGGADSRSLSL